MAHAAAGRDRLPGPPHLDLEFLCDADRRTFVGRQYACHPFHVCRALYQDAGLPTLATLYIQSCSGGLYENDRLRLSFTARAGSEAHVSTQSATVVHSMPEGSAVQHCEIVCEAGAYFEYLPDPQVLFPGSACTSSIAVRMAPGATAIVSDAFLVHDPSATGGFFRSYRSEIVIGDIQGEAKAIDRLMIDGDRKALSPAGAFGHFGAQGTVLIAAFDAVPQGVAAFLEAHPFDYAEAAIGVSELPSKAGLVIRILAADGTALKRAMHLAWRAARLALKGNDPIERRK